MSEQGSATGVPAEADEISMEDLLAAAEIYDRLWEAALRERSLIADNEEATNG